VEDLSLEDLIADVVTNPTPDRVSCEPTAPIVSPTAPPRTGLVRIWRGVVRRLRAWRMRKPA
jgi:hypothetical protein